MDALTLTWAKSSPVHTRDAYFEWLNGVAVDTGYLAAPTFALGLHNEARRRGARLRVVYSDNNFIDPMY